MTGEMKSADNVVSLLSISNLTKSFGPTVVLDNVSLEVLSGEIHGLVGQNGSGKSTIIKCLSGYHSQEMWWQLRVRDRVITRGLHPGEIASYGISFVHQDLGMLPELTVLENLLMTELAGSNAPFISWKKAYSTANATFADFGLSLDPSVTLSSLRPVEQAQVAIIRAVMQLRNAKHTQNEPGVLVLDEATTFLDEMGREGVHNLLRTVVSNGDGVIFVSHDIGEILRLTDRVTVLRDGKVAYTSSTSSLDHDDVVSLIVGGSANQVSSQESIGITSAQNQELRINAPGMVGKNGRHSFAGGSSEHFLKVSGMTGEYVSDVSVEVAAGQVLGITGIVGSGWEFVLEYLFGSQKAYSGYLEIGGRVEHLSSMTPIKARALSMVLVPSDRLVQGVVAELSVQDNVMQPSLHDVFRAGFLRLKELSAKCALILERYGIVPKNPKLPISALSGGNQQKAVIVKWLETGPDYVLLNEPTQGVDVGARQRIYELVEIAAQRGAVVLFASSDWEEISTVSDKVLVMADGHISAELSKEDTSVDAIARAAYLGTRKSADLSKAASLWTLE